MRCFCNFPRLLIAGRAFVFITSEPYALDLFVVLSITRVGAHIFDVVRTIKTDFYAYNNALASPIRVNRFTDFPFVSSTECLTYNNNLPKERHRRQLPTLSLHRQRHQWLHIYWDF
jgi:hypothetical protein